jgi:hypothetical protein
MTRPGGGVAQWTGTEDPGSNQLQKTVSKGSSFMYVMFNSDNKDVTCAH